MEEITWEEERFGREDEGFNCLVGGTGEKEDQSLVDSMESGIRENATYRALLWGQGSSGCSGSPD